MPNSDPEGWICVPFDLQRLIFNESHSHTLTSTIMKVDVVCEVTMTSSPNVLMTELRDVLYNQCIDVLLFIFYLSYGSDKGM